MTETEDTTDKADIYHTNRIEESVNLFGKKTKPFSSIITIAMKKVRAYTTKRN